MENILDMFRLDGKVALVTGGSGNYGKQMVIGLAQAGATVCTASRNLEANRKFAEELNAQGLNNVYADSYDQGDEESILALRDRMIEKFGRVDILVNNSVFRKMGDFDGDIADFEQSMHINATGLFMITRAFGNHMAQIGGGSIINIGSYMGNLGSNDTLYQGLPEMDASGAPDYFFHKGGMHNLTRLIASYYGTKNVRCNCIALGGFFNHQDPKFLKQYYAATFLKRMANDTDVMGLLVYLASDASSYMTGAVIPLDGGYSAK